MRRILLALAVVCLASCGTPGDANEVNGKELFVARCGGCHALDRAGTAGMTGPDLDSAFARARRDGFPRSTIRGIVKGQILHPRRGGLMPAGLVTGDDARDVAAYVAQSAAVPGRDQGRLADVGVRAGGPPGRQLFAREGCSGCHALSDAGSTGTVGPDLDAGLEGRPKSFVRESIVNPDAEIADGFSPGVMPGDYASRLSGDEIDALVKYLHDVTR